MTYLSILVKLVQSTKPNLREGGAESVLSAKEGLDDMRRRRGRIVGGSGGIIKEELI